MRPAAERRIRLSLLFACVVSLSIITGRFALCATYSYALEAHSLGEYSKAFPIFYGNALFEDAGACGLVGTMYLLGQGVERDGVSAEYWLLKAARKGSVISQSMLGTMYATGKGVPKDDRKARLWLFRAAAGGDETASFALRKLHKGTLI